MTCINCGKEIRRAFDTIIYVHKGNAFFSCGVLTHTHAEPVPEGLLLVADEAEL